MKKLLKSPIFWILLVLIIGGGFIASMRLEQARQAQATVEVERPPLPVEVVTVQRDSVRAFVMGEGTVRAARREFLTFESSGRVTLIGQDRDGGELREGSLVSGPRPGEEHGQLLAQLDQREILAMIDMEKAALEQARQNVSVAHATVTQAETEYELAKADFERFVRRSEEGTTLALREEELTQANERVAALEAAVAQAESNFQLAAVELERVRQLTQSGFTLRGFEEVLAQARQNLASAEAAVTRAKNDHALAITNFEKAENLFKDGIIAKTQYDEAQAQLLNAETALQSAQATVKAAQSQVNSAENELEKAKINVPVAEMATAQAQYRSAEAALRTAKANLKGAKSQANTATTRLEQAKIDVPGIEYEAAKAKHLNAGATLQTAAANLQSAQSQVDAALARMKQAELQLEHTNIFAPFNGMITYLNVNLGDLVSPQSMSAAGEQAMLQTAPIVLIDPSEYEITVDLPAYIGSEVEPGQPVEIVSSGSPLSREYAAVNPSKALRDSNPAGGAVTRGSVYSVSPSISPGRRSIQVKIRTDGDLRDGMFVTVTIVVQEKEDVLTLPINSMIFRQNTAYTFVVDPETKLVTKRQIVGGIGSIQQQEVLEGVEEGELVVTDGRYRLIEGMKIEILNL